MVNSDTIQLTKIFMTAIGIICLIFSGIFYVCDRHTLETRCEIVQHQILENENLIGYKNYEIYYGVCYIVHELTEKAGEHVTWCRPRRIGKTSTEMEAEEMLEKYPIGKYYDCYYSGWDYRTGSYDARYDWYTLSQIGLVFLVVLALIVLIHSITNIVILRQRQKQQEQMKKDD